MWDNLKEIREALGDFDIRDYLTEEAKELDKILLGNGEWLNTTTNKGS